MESLTNYYLKLNKAKEDDTRKDATLFIQGARLFKSTDDISITFEEYIAAICRIVKVHEMKVVDILLINLNKSERKLNLKK